MRRRQSLAMGTQERRRSSSHTSGKEASSRRWQSFAVGGYAGERRGERSGSEERGMAIDGGEEGRRKYKSLIWMLL